MPTYLDRAGRGHHERQVDGADPLGEQADLCVAEDQRGQAAVGQHGAARHRGRRGRPAGECLADGGTHDRAHGHLLRPQPHRPDQGARGRADRTGTRTGHLPQNPPQWRRQRGAHRDALPQRRDLALLLQGPGHRLRRSQADRADQRGAGRRPDPAVCGQRCSREAADRCREADGGTGGHARDPSRSRSGPDDAWPATMQGSSTSRLAGRLRPC